MMHGDAAFAGQGICAETLNMAGVEGFAVGGSVHIIVNNLIGFTTAPKDGGSSRYSSDLAKRLPIPIFHVNAEDPDAVVRVGRMALDYRYEFGTPVFVDLIGYRRHGHSEVDDPTITQPVRYRKIEAHPPMWQIYAEKIGAAPEPIVQRVREELDAAQKEAQEIEKSPPMRRLPRYWGGFQGGRYDASFEVETAVAAESLTNVGEGLVRYPDGFHIHAKVKKLLEQRLEMARGKRAIDFGMAEALAFGSLLKQGVPVRLTGQDSRRGTFNQRHSALIDIETEEEYVPLEHLAQDPAWCEIYNSPLSEAAVLGFEYGFSRDFPEALVLWEAQFGDFANGAQIIIDQFIAASEDKWNLLSGIVLLLPHGYEGQGPEHSSARIERFLQLAARDNIQICQPSTAAQYFHLLRRQALRNVAKTSGRLHAEEHAAESGGFFAARRSHERSLSNRDSRFGRRLRRARIALHRQDRPRARRRTKAASGESSGDHFCRAAVSLPGSGTRGRNGSPRERAGICVGTGRTGQYGRARIRDSGTRAAGPRPRGPFGESLGEREPRYGFAQGSRNGAEDAPRSRVRKVAGVRAAIFPQTRENIRLWPLTITGRSSFDDSSSMLRFRVSALANSRQSTSAQIRACSVR